jgi:hypothetical protein
MMNVPFCQLMWLVGGQYSFPSVSSFPAAEAGRAEYG